jgi:preprotein translocase SecE subunit
VRTARTERDETPAPISHAAPDVELAEAQLALGRPDLADAAEPDAVEGVERAAEAEPDDDEGLEPNDGGSGSGRADRPTDADFDGEGPPPGGGELVAPGGAVPEPRARPGSRLINFLQGSWRELQRVQWPDRRQVMQATGVVIGFVIVAGAFLGVADFLAGKVVNYILTGHFK